MTETYYTMNERQLERLSMAIADLASEAAYRVYIERSSSPSEKELAMRQDIADALAVIRAGERS